MSENICIRGTNWVGDSIITIPALRELRRIFPQARLTLVARPWVSGIFEGTGLVDDLLTYDSRSESFWTCVQKIKSRKFDRAILFQNAFEAAALMFCARVPVRVGFPTDARRWLLTQAVPLEPATHRKHQIYYYLDLVSRYEEHLTGQSQVNFNSPAYQLRIPAEKREAIRFTLIQRGLNPDRQWIAINPGATNSEAKRWPIESFAKLIDQLIERGDTEVCLIGAANESDISQAVVEQSRYKSAIRILTGTTSLAESIAFLTWCSLVISNDTGPAYVTAALDRPLLTIFGPTDPHMISPFSPQAHMIRNLVHCAPCMLRKCPIDHRCMQNITPQEVFHRAIQVLEASQ